MNTISIKTARIARAADAIVRIVDGNSNITVADLHDELVRGAIDGWASVATRYRLTFSDWSAAMQRAIDLIEEAAVENANVALGEEREPEITTSFSFERVAYNGANGWLATRWVNGVYSGKQFGKTRVAATDAFSE